MFCDRSRNTDDVNFLKRIVSDKLRDNLTGKHNKRHRIHIRISNAGDSVCCARARSSKHNTWFACRLGISFCGMCCSLFVPRKNVLDVRYIKQYIMDTDENSAWIPKEDINAFLNKAPYKYFCPRHRFPLMIVLCFCRSHCIIPSIV